LATRLKIEYLQGDANMNNVFIKDVVYDTMSNCFFNLTYTSQEKADKHILDTLGFLPIRQSEDRSSVNIYKVKGKNKLVKIRYYRADFNSVREYQHYITSILAEHGRNLKDLILVKKVVDRGLYKKICELAKTRKTTKLLTTYGWL
jgi:hypothetical protein